MTATAVHDRNVLAAEYLQLLRSLAGEMEKAMQAIAHNRLPDLEESVANQQIMSDRLLILAAEITPTIQATPATERDALEPDLLGQVRIAGDALQSLNRRYAALLQHSSRSIALMASLFSGYQGQFQQQSSQQSSQKIREASGAGSKHQTWSCQM